MGKASPINILRGWLLPALSGLLMALAYPPFNITQLAWLCLIPVLFAIEGCAPAEAFRRGYVAGLVFFGMTVWWVGHVTLPGTVGLVAFLGLYFGVATAWFTILAGNRLSATNNLLAAGLSSAGWVVLEWVRGVFLLGGFPWNFLGVSQHWVTPVIQFASVTGVYGVSALVCFVNFALYFTVCRYARQIREKNCRRHWSGEFYVAMLLVCLAMWHGIHACRTEKHSRALRLALVQGNIPQTLKFEPSQKPMILERYRTLTEVALAGRPDLIIWPETATPEAVRFDLESYALVTNLAGRANAPLLTGTIDFETPNAYNAAVLVRPDGTVAGVYRKVHLVPFGEYVPLRKIFPFLKWLTPIGDSFERGKKFPVLEAAGTRFATVICFEDTVPGLYRQFARQGVDFMVNVTNDGWFKESPAAEMHLANAKFRAVETRRPLVRATNNGVTCIVDARGVERDRLEPFTEGSTNCILELPAVCETTFYTKYGDVFVAGCALISAMGIGMRSLLRRSARSDSLARTSTVHP